MNLFEYEGKQLLREFDIPTPEGALLSAEDSPAPMSYPFVLKAQVMTGGRGKAGGVKVCRNEEEYRQYAGQILRMEIKGHPVHGLLAEQMLSAEQELYLSITQQGVSRPTLIFSRCGGMDIESVAREAPDEVLKFEIDPYLHLKEYQKRQLIEKMGVEPTEAKSFLEKLERAFFGTNALLVEINPLGIVDGKLIAMDAKAVLDDHARAATERIRAYELASSCPLRVSSSARYITSSVVMPPSSAKLAT